MIPRATYRLQFRNGMDFDKAIGIIPYLQRLGISHLYASPIYAAVSGSTHGYDVIDNNLVEPALGGRDGLIALSGCLKQAGMGLILDIVPNHMAASLENPWWRDVVEWGACGKFANHFDINWHSKLTLPILAGDFETALAAGDISLKYDQRNACLAIAYFNNLIPLHPASYGQALAPAGLADDLSACAATARPGDGKWRNLLRTLGERDGFDGLLAILSGDRAHMRRLHELQPWTLLCWRDAARAISYRRFFEIAGLVGLRMEDRHVFDAVHRLTFELVDADVVQGLRIDHVDGLADPREYLDRLRSAAGPDLYIVVEKILAENEALPVDWPVHGTTGYEFISAVSRVFVDPTGHAELEDAYRTASAMATDLEAERREAKLLIITRNFAGELARLAQLAHGLNERFAIEDIELAITEMIAAFPVYRTYGDETGMSARDIRLLEAVSSSVREGDKYIPLEVLKWLVMTLAAAGGESALELRRRFQQLTSAVMAKAVEDTLFYRWHALIALNEVGCDPAWRAHTHESLHQLMTGRRDKSPHTLLATATHDTKHGEDSRARLYALSDQAHAWLQAVKKWPHIHCPQSGGGSASEEGLGSLIYQSLASIWPALPGEEVEFTELRPRLASFLEKALREAKLRTSWTEVDAGYEQAVTGFAQQLLDDRAFRKDFASTIQPLVEAGAIISLGQTLLKLTSPGIPDIYQGSERGDLSLVDPDNRRPIDFPLLEKYLANPLAIPDCRALLDGHMKQKLIEAALALRLADPDLFSFGTYEPLGIHGIRKDNALAYLRRHASRAIVVIIPRSTPGLSWPTAPQDYWRDTHIALPPAFSSSWDDVLLRAPLQLADNIIPLGRQLAAWPVGLLCDWR